MVDDHYLLAGSLAPAKTLWQLSSLILVESSPHHTPDTGKALSTVTVAAGNQPAGPEELFLCMQSTSVESESRWSSSHPQSQPYHLACQYRLSWVPHTLVLLQWQPLFAVDSTVTQVVGNSCYNGNAWVLFGCANITLSGTVRLNLIGGQIYFLPWSPDRCSTQRRQYHKRSPSKLRFIRTLGRQPGSSCSPGSASIRHSASLTFEDSILDNWFLKFGVQCNGQPMLPRRLSWSSTWKLYAFLKVSTRGIES